MRQEVFEIVQKMDKDNIRTQMALQCAPLITGLKVANLLIIPSKNEKYVGAILDGTRRKADCLAYAGREQSSSY